MGCRTDVWSTVEGSDFPPHREISLASRTTLRQRLLGITSRHTTSTIYSRQWSHYCYFWPLCELGLRATWHVVARIQTHTYTYTYIYVCHVPSKMCRRLPWAVSAVGSPRGCLSRGNLWRIRIQLSLASLRLMSYISYKKYI